MGTKYAIRTCKNGCILKITSGEDGSDELVHCDGELEAFAVFLNEILDSYGPQRDSYGPRNISVQIKAGRKYECEFTYAGVKVVADEPTDAAGEYAGELMNEVHFFKRWKIPLDYISIHNGVVKGHERREP